jgi:hypothetical protein
MAIMKVVASFAAVIAAKISADEVNAWLPWAARQLVAFAVRLVPEDERSRYSEEWSSYLTEVPGDVGKILAAAGFLVAGVRIDLAWSRSEETQDTQANAQETYVRGRLNFGPLPEPERSPASFISSAILNGAILLFAILIGAAAKLHVFQFLR